MSAQVGKQEPAWAIRLEAKVDGLTESQSKTRNQVGALSESVKAHIHYHEKALDRAFTRINTNEKGIGKNEDTLAAYSTEVERSKVVEKIAYIAIGVAATLVIAVLKAELGLE